MKDGAFIACKERTTRLLAVLAFVFGVLPLFTVFSPYVEYQLGGAVYEISAMQVLLASGLDVQGSVVLLPMVMKISCAVSIIGCILGAFAILLKKPIFSAVCFVGSSVTPLVCLLSSASVQEQATRLNISSVVITYRLPFIFTLIFALVAAIFAIWTKGTEKLAEAIFLVFACVSVGSVAIITVYMIISGAPAIAEIGLLNFIFGTAWKPTQGLFGILPMILSSIAATFGAILIGVPVGVLTAVFLSEVAPRKLADFVRPAVQLLAGIPSVIYGFFGMLVIVPFIRGMFPGKTIGDSLLAIIVILAIMVLPTIVSVTENSLRAVPNSYREAALALGTTPVKTIFKVTVPAAKSGILSGVILGVGRAIGETMAVIMVAGNVVNMPSILGTVRLLTTGIVLEMSYSSGLHRQALFAIGLILFLFIMIVNISFTVISKRGVQMDGR